MDVDVDGCCAVCGVGWTFCLGQTYGRTARYLDEGDAEYKCSITSILLVLGQGVEQMSKCPHL